MKLCQSSTLLASLFLSFLFSCNQSKESAPKSEGEEKPAATAPAPPAYGGFESKVKWGEHLVMICGCHDCHTPKKFGPNGMELDMTLALSGHPAKMPAPDVNKKEMESKGNIVTQDLTAWLGPWGVSFTANLTPDETGVGNWKEEQFIYAIRNGVTKGLQGSRPILPPMPWQIYKTMSDDELKAIFAYLKSITPIKNLVPAPLPPVSVPKKS